ncbi:tyrosine--tRNA ligase [Candidatus Gracilibacteria bacterium]|nr:tyrosine--tRNA ligase [Candidatus Gracilibacteria bacterium]MCF7819333.1 tyrosine--tRNA ligase [Candidatus Gracilibacteria bacterium]
MSKNKIQRTLSRGVEQILPEKSVLEKLMQKKKIRLYLGIDPTGSLLTLGHGVALKKLQQFAELGHQVILLVGSGTVKIGDPTGRDTTRPVLTEEQIKENFKHWKKQASKILDFENIEVRYNSKWLDKLQFDDLVRLMGKVTVQQLLERDMFQKRISEGKPIFGHEIIYPLLQGYDSVAMDVDLEIGGNDQTFNMLMGRTLQRIYNNHEKFVLTTPLIPGTDGRKMSQSYHNFIALSDEPKEMFGKLMSVADEVMEQYYEIFTDEDMQEMKQFIKKDPRNAKVHLAKSIVTWLHSAKDADAAEKDFVTKFVKKEVPDEMPEFEIKKKEIGVLDLIVDVCRFANSKSEARRLIQQGGVSLDGQRIEDPNKIIHFEGGEILKVGKRKFAKIKK